MKSILVISHSSSLTGGGEEDLLRLLKFFHDKYELTGIFPEGKNVPEFQKYVKDYLIVPNIMLPFTKFNLKLYVSFIIKSILYKRRKIKDFLEGREFDLIYIHSSVCYYEFLLLKNFNYRIIVTAREVINPKFLRRFIYKDYLKHASKVVCISNYVKDFFTQYDQKDKLKVIPCAIEEIKVNPIKVDANSDKKVFLIIGNIHPLKDQLTVIKAFRNLDDLKISLHIVGSVSDTQYHQSLIRENQDLLDSGQIKFIGELTRNTLMERINESFAVIIASHQEGFSLVFLEACQFGKPVISTQVGIMKEVVTDSENGLLFERGDYKMLSSKIKSLLGNNDLYNNVSTNALLCMKNFSIDKMMQAYEDLFNKVIHDKVDYI